MFHITTRTTANLVHNDSLVFLSRNWSSQVMHHIRSFAEINEKINSSVCAAATTKGYHSISTRCTYPRRPLLICDTIGNTSHVHKIDCQGILSALLDPQAPKIESRLPMMKLSQNQNLLFILLGLVKSLAARGMLPRSGSEVCSMA